MFSLFGSSSPFDPEVEKATSENNTTEQWDQIIDICDKVGSSSKNAKDCIRSIMKRMGHTDPHVAIQAITLLDACIKNCGLKFHLEIASREFETEFQRLMLKNSFPVAQKMRVSLKKWADNEFKTDPQLNLIPSLYQKLKLEGFAFVDTTSQPQKSPPPLSKDPNVVSSQQEEEDIAKAIELSLKDKGEGSKVQTTAAYSSLYPSMNSTSNNQSKDSPKQSSSASSSSKKDARKVRALYDFEAAEDNELTFFSGEIIHVLDDSDPNWWTGYNDRGEGLFPSNFVTADLNAEVESNRFESKTKKTSVSELKEDAKQEIVQIDEMKIDRLLHLLHEANPEDPSQDTEEMFILEAQVNQMLPLIDSELERVDRSHAKLTQLSSNLVEAINMYHMLMRESDMQLGSYGMNQMPGQLYRQQGQPISNGMYHPNMYAAPSNYSMPPQMGNQFQMGGMSMQQFPPGAGMPPQMQQVPPQYQYPVTNEQPQSLQSMQQPQMQQPNHLQQTTVASTIHSMPQNQIAAGAPIGNVHMPQQMHPGAAPMQHMGAIPQAQYQQSMAPPPSNYQPVNNSNPVAGHPTMVNNQPQPNMQMNAGHLPNTVMTTQQQPSVQHHHQQQQQQQQQQPPPMQQAPVIHQNPSPNHQHMMPNPNVMAAINQPVSTTILPQNDMRSNIPIYQQQR